MNRFYNAVILIGWMGTIVMGCLISTSPLPGWKWVVAFVAMIMMDLGAYAVRDKKRDEEDRRK